MLCERVCGLLVFYWGLIGFLSFLFVLICVHLLVNDDTECKVDYPWFNCNRLIKLACGTFLHGKRDACAPRGLWRILPDRQSSCLSRFYQASDLSASCCLGFVEDGGDVAAQGGFGAAEAEADAFVAQASRQ